MKKSKVSRVNCKAADVVAETTEKSHYSDHNSLCPDKDQIACLTTLLGTQPLLTASAPSYPLIKAIEVVN